MSFLPDELSDFVYDEKIPGLIKKCVKDIENCDMMEYKGGFYEIKKQR